MSIFFFCYFWSFLSLLLAFGTLHSILHSELLQRFLWLFGCGLENVVLQDFALSLLDFHTEGLSLYSFLRWYPYESTRWITLSVKVQIRLSSSSLGLGILDQGLLVPWVTTWPVCVLQAWRDFSMALCLKLCMVCNSCHIWTVWQQQEMHFQCCQSW